MELQIVVRKVTSRRQNRNKSGRNSRRRANGFKTVQRAGGYTSAMRAIYAPADHPLCRTYEDVTGIDANSNKTRFTSSPQTSHKYSTDLGGR